MPQQIHKVNILKEAVFDYEQSFGLRLPYRDIKSNVEEYIPLMLNNGKLLQAENFCVKYYDNGLDEMLLLFIHKGAVFGIMQSWDIYGICLEDEWDEPLDYYGIIRAWLNSPIDLTDIPLYDWVIRHRAIEVVENMVTYKLQGLTE